jgi:uncharacterized protein with PQ loop repeat
MTATCVHPVWLLTPSQTALALRPYEPRQLVAHPAACVQVLWHASIYLESVAILPQLMLIIRTQNIDNLTGNYIFLLGAYRGLYILNWIYRFFTEPKYVHWLGMLPRSSPRVLPTMWSAALRILAAMWISADMPVVSHNHACGPTVLPYTT